MPAHPSSTDLASIVAAQMRSVQSEDVDWVSLPLTATPTNPRNRTNTLANFHGCHYESDTPGSRQELIK